MSFVMTPTTVVSAPVLERHPGLRDHYDNVEGEVKWQ